MLLIGGGFLWEFIFAPLMRWMGFGILSVFSSISDEYLNILYRDVASLYFDSLAAVPGSLLAGIFLGFLTFTAIRVGKELAESGQSISVLDKLKSWEDMLSYKEAPPEDFTKGPFDAETFARYRAIHIEPKKERQRRMERMYYWGVIPCTLLMFVLFPAIIAHISAQREAYSWVHRSLDIVAPYVDTKSRLMLLSEFRQVETSADFFELKGKIEALSVANSVKLPRGNFIGEK